MDTNLKKMINERKVTTCSDYSESIENLFMVLMANDNTEERFFLNQHHVGDKHYEQKSIQVKKCEKLDDYKDLNGVREIYLDANEYWGNYPQYITAIVMEYKYKLQDSSYEKIIRVLGDYYNSLSMPFEYFCIINRDTIQFIIPINIKCNKESYIKNLANIEKIREYLSGILKDAVKRGELSNNSDLILIPGAIYNGYQAKALVQTKFVNNYNELCDSLCKEAKIAVPDENKKTESEPLLPNTQPLKKRMGKTNHWRFYYERAINITDDIKFLVQYKKLSTKQQEKLFNMVTKMLLQIKHNTAIYPKCPKDVMPDQNIKRIIIEIHKNIGIKLNENVEKINADELKKIFNDNHDISYIKELKSGYRKPMYIYTSKKFLEILKPTEIESTYMVELLTDEELKRRHNLRVKRNNEKNKQIRHENKEKRNEEWKAQYFELNKQGLKQTEIARRMNIQYPSLCRKLKKLGVR